MKPVQEEYLLRLKEKEALPQQLSLPHRSLPSPAHVGVCGRLRATGSLACREFLHLSFILSVAARYLTHESRSKQKFWLNLLNFSV